MNDAGQTAEDCGICGLHFEIHPRYKSLDALEQAVSKNDGAHPWVAHSTVSIARAADPRREAVETALVEAIRTVLEAVDEGDDDIVVPADILSRLRAALKVVEQASLSDTEEGGRA